MYKVPRTINFNEKLLKNLDNDKFDPTLNIFEVKKERIAMIIAPFEIAFFEFLPTKNSEFCDPDFRSRIWTLIWGPPIRMVIKKGSVFQA